MKFRNSANCLEGRGAKSKGSETIGPNYDGESNI